MAQVPSTLRIHNPRELWEKEQEAKEAVTKAEFNARVNAPSRLTKLEQEMAGIKDMLGQIANRLNEKK